MRPSLDLPRLTRGGKRLFRRIRGALGAALAWAASWALLGSLSTIVATVVPPGGSAWFRTPAALLDVVLESAKTFGLLGAFCGATFGVVLAVVGRRVAFARLRSSTVLEAGALGGALVPMAVLAVRAIVLGAPDPDVYTAIAASSLLGAGSAWVMLRLARKVESAKPPEQLKAGISVPGFHQGGVRVDVPANSVTPPVD